jgi:NAD(P)-dependent dehydrogenase (short-subunit alcohol dehydrogenase family)
VLDVDQEGGKIVEALASEYYQASFSFHQVDITDWDELATTFEQIYDTQQRIDIVVANAGISREASFTIDEEKPTKPGLLTLEINLIGTIYSTLSWLYVQSVLLTVRVAIKLATHYIKKNKLVGESEKSPRGCIICTASIASLYPFSLAPVYAAAKHGVVGLVRSLSAHLKRENIQISAVAPAFIRMYSLEDCAYG